MKLNTYQILLFLFVFASMNDISVLAQTAQYQRIEIAKANGEFEYILPTNQVGQGRFMTMAFIGELDFDWNGVAIRVFEHGQWMPWKTLVKDAHVAEEIEENSYSELQYLSSDVSKIQVRQNQHHVLNLNADLFNPGVSDLDTDEILFRSKCELPVHLTRKKWCPDNSCPWGTERTSTTATHLIVHHSAGPNNRSDWDAVVRSIWNFHVVTRGWDDIGYNWLISPKGVLYEGRGEGIRGAHFSGHNSGTTGICMMGTYTDVAPTNVAIMMLEEFLSWSANKWNISPLKTSLHASSGLSIKGVSGHRDGGATSCPGDVLYGKLSVIRTNVQKLLDDCEGIDTTGNGGDTITVNRNPNTFDFKWSMSNKELKIEIGKFINRPLFLYLYDMNGRLIWRKKIKQQDTVYDVSSLASGIYVIKIENKKYVDKLYKVVKI